MGLDVSHDAFGGAYSAFNRFRQAICQAMGGSFPPHEIEQFSDGTVLEKESWYWGNGFSPESHPGLQVLLSHSDCDGTISWRDCALVARDLSSLLPAIEAFGDGGGHISAAGGYGAVARRFIVGCELAASEREALEFH